MINNTNKTMQEQKMSTQRQKYHIPIQKCFITAYQTIPLFSSKAEEPLGSYPQYSLRTLASLRSNEQLNL